MRSKKSPQASRNETPTHVRRSHLRTWVFPVLLAIVLGLAAAIDLGSQHRNFDEFGHQVQATSVVAIVVANGANGSPTTTTHLPVRTLHQRSQILHVLTLLSQSKSIKRLQRPLPKHPTYTLFIETTGQRALAVNLFQVHRFPLQDAAVVDGHTYLCPSSLARTLKTLRP